MKKSKLLLVIVMLLLTVDIGFRIFNTPEEANAAGKVQYQIQEIPYNGDSINQIAYQNLLNEMAEQGWVFDHTTTEMGFSMYAVFKN